MKYIKKALTQKYPNIFISVNHIKCVIKQILKKIISITIVFRKQSTVYT